jgi:hypothetical protein
VAGPQHPLNLAGVFAHVDRHRDEFVERLAGWVRQPSVSATGQGMPQAAAEARRLVAGVGLDARVEETAGWPLVLGHRAGMAAAPGHRPAAGADARRQPPAARVHRRARHLGAA